jgi:hypothetical protein
MVQVDYTSHHSLLFLLHRLAELFCNGVPVGLGVDLTSLLGSRGGEVDDGSEGREDRDGLHTYLNKINVIY